MRLIIGLLPVVLAAQTAVFPGAVVTDAQLKVQVNGVRTSLTASLSISALTASVLTCTGIPANSLATMGTEIVAVTSCSGNTLTMSARHFDNSVATAHSVGTAVTLFVEAWHHNALKAEVEAIETTLGQIIGLGGSVTSIAAGFFNCTATGTNPCAQQAQSTFHINGNGDGFFQNVAGALFNCTATSTNACVQQFQGTFHINGNGDGFFQNVTVTGSLSALQGSILVSSSGDSFVTIQGTALAGAATVQLNGQGVANNWDVKASGGGFSIVDRTAGVTALSMISTGASTFVSTVRAGGFLSSDGSAGVTGATCSAWKNGLCTTP